MRYRILRFTPQNAHGCLASFFMENDVVKAIRCAANLAAADVCQENFVGAADVASVGVVSCDDVRTPCVLIATDGRGVWLARWELHAWTLPVDGDYQSAANWTPVHS